MIVIQLVWVFILIILIAKFYQASIRIKLVSEALQTITIMVILLITGLLVLPIFSLINYLVENYDQAGVQESTYSPALQEVSLLFITIYPRLIFWYFFYNTRREYLQWNLNLNRTASMDQGRKSEFQFSTVEGLFIDLEERGKTATQRKSSTLENSTHFISMDNQHN